MHATAARRRLGCCWPHSAQAPLKPGLLSCTAEPHCLWPGPSPLSVPRTRHEVLDHDEPQAHALPSCTAQPCCLPPTPHVTQYAPAMRRLTIMRPRPMLSFMAPVSGSLNLASWSALNPVPVSTTLNTTYL